MKVLFVVSGLGAQRRWARQHATASASAAALLAVYAKYLVATGIRVEPA